MNRETEPAVAGHPGVAARLGVLAVGAVAPILIVLFWLDGRTQVPVRLATHWGSDGKVDGTTDAAAMFGWTLGISVLLAVAGVVLRFRSATSFRMTSRASGRLPISLLIGGAWTAAGLLVACVMLARHAVDVSATHLPIWVGALMVVVPLGAGVLAWFLSPVGNVAMQAFPRSTVALTKDERVVWISHVHSAPLRLVAAAVAVLSLGLLFVSLLLGIVLFAVALLLTGATELRVRIDDRGLHTLWGPLGWPRPVIALDQISGVTAETVIPTKWGGWGYRITSRGTAAIIRTGPGLVVQRKSGSTYVVTVDDAAEGADLLLALMSRADAH